MITPKGRKAKAERKETMKHLYRIDWIIKANRQETKEYCYVEADNATEAKKRFCEYGRCNSPYHKKSHAFHIEVKRNEEAADIPMNIFILV